jgi:hypothetical protein
LPVVFAGSAANAMRAPGTLATNMTAAITSAPVRKRRGTIVWTDALAKLVPRETSRSSIMVFIPHLAACSASPPVFYFKR